jgi:hypothetical protein
MNAILLLFFFHFSHLQIHSCIIHQQCVYIYEVLLTKLIQKTHKTLMLVYFVKYSDAQSEGARMRVMCQRRASRIYPYPRPASTVFSNNAAGKKVPE